MADNLIKFGTATCELCPAPINPEWILEGNPVTRCTCLARSSDGISSSYIWDCTAGRFNWYYKSDETVCVLEGSVHVRDHDGASQLLEAGGTAYFPAGSSAEWTVQNYVRKVAFIRHPLPRSIVFAKRVYSGLKKVARFGRAPSGNAAPSMS